MVGSKAASKVSSTAALMAVMKVVLRVGMIVDERALTWAAMTARGLAGWKAAVLVE